ncbi:MAG TPA: hypothetical protein VEC75_09490 [Stellaceae bacterium]|nr:hypothetical protein [Stellaceae bacterium]
MQLATRGWELMQSLCERLTSLKSTTRAAEIALAECDLVLQIGCLTAVELRLPVQL